MMTNVVLSSALFIFTLLTAIGSSDVDFLRADEERRGLEGDLACPYADEERLYYNIDIYIEGVGEGCESYDLYNIGEMLDVIVDEVEEEIPEYKQTERMETTICPYPEEEDMRRNLRAQVDGKQSERFLQQNKNRRRKKRYKYRGSGKCRRCRRNNNDRRLQQTLVLETCEQADMAAYAASITAIAVKNSNKIVMDIRQYVLQYCNYFKSGQETVLNAKRWAQEAREALKIAQAESRRAMAQCQQVKRAATDLERMKFVRNAATASNDAMNAAKNARSRYVRLQELLETNICFQEPIVDNGYISIQAVCNKADQAEFGADMAATAVMTAGELYSELKQRAMECSDLGASQEFVMKAKAALSRVKQNQKTARGGAQKVRAQCQLATEASSGIELSQYMEQAQKLLNNVLDATERADSAFLNMRDIVGERDVCYKEGSPTMEISAKAVCERTNVAVFAADIATTALRSANTAFSQLRERAFECNDLSGAQTWVKRANEFLAQCKASRKQALKESKRANSLCRDARKASSDANKLREIMLAAGTASSSALSAVETAKSRYLAIDEQINKEICAQGLKAASNNINAQAVCEHADTAKFGADLTIAAIKSANDEYSSLRESAMECNDLTLGQESGTKAQQSLKAVQKSRKLAANGARRANQECKKAQGSTSSQDIAQSLVKVKKYAADSMKAAERARTSYYRIQDSNTGTSICDGIDKSPGGGSDSADIEATFQTKETWYSGGSGGGNEESLRLWLVKLANMLYDKIPQELMKAYSDSDKPDGCQLEGFKVSIRIDAFEEIDDSEYFISERKDCVSVRV